MFLAGKIAWAGIVFLLLATGIPGPRPTLSHSGVERGKEVPAVPHPNDVKRMQQTLLEQGHYRGEVDGVFGLRTRASIRAYQKAQSLPITGHLDNETAGRLGSDLRFARRPTSLPRKTSLRQAQSGPKVRGVPARHHRRQSRNRPLLKADLEITRRHFNPENEKPSAVLCEHICSDLPDLIC
jgi:peptidoglycan hydrolase-like protein with peptidoglycan-binding domain